VDSAVGDETTFAAQSLSPVLTTALRFEDVYREQAPFVWRLLRGMGVPEAAADDATQDVFIIVHRGLGKFDGRNPIRSWLFAIAYRVANNYGRQHRRTRNREPLDDQLKDPAPTPNEAAERTQEMSVLGALLERLSDEKRALLILAEIEGMSIPEIATVTQTPVNTVYTRLRRARIELGAAFSEWKKGRP
jgi:RNA polymerase sigma-70 factor (ECF subfamily)